MSARLLGPILAALLAWIVGGCALDETYVAPTAPVIEADSAGVVTEPEFSVLLIGDAGLAESSEQPVLALLRREVLRAPERTLVLFLGDNVYPKGLRGGNAVDAARLVAQRDVVAHSGAAAVFLAGNHDVREDGIAGLRRQATLLAEAGDARVRMLPPPGRPGPVVLDLPSSLRLVLLDTTWWFERPGEDDGRRESEREAVVAALAEAVHAPGRRVVVAGHHPPRSHGPHGGFFPWDRHVFPLREAWSPLWIPLPVVGSLAPVARWLGITSTDQSSSEYRVYVEDLTEALRDDPPLVVVGGHEHSLQVLAGGPADYVLVSGAGTLDRRDPLTARDDTLLASPHAGFLRLDVSSDRVALTLFGVDDDEVERPPVSLCLPPTGRDPSVERSW